MKPSKKKKHNQEKTCCPECGASIQLVNGMDMHFRFTTEETKNQMYWRCSHYPACNTYIIADPKTKKPTGLMGGSNLRHKRIAIHKWEEMFVEAGKMSRVAFRDMCASQIGMRVADYHARYITEMDCNTILQYLQRLYEINKGIHDMVEARPNSTIWKEVRGLNKAPNHGVVYDLDGAEIGMLERISPSPEAKKCRTKK